MSQVSKSENSAAIEAAKKEASNLKRRVERLYKKCVEEIEKLTKEHLPRKVKGGGTSKCQGEFLLYSLEYLCSDNDVHPSFMMVESCTHVAFEMFSGCSGRQGIWG